MRVRGYGVAEVGPNERALNDFAEAVGDVHVSDLEFIDGPHIGSANTSFGFALGDNGFGHVGPRGHVLRGERAAGKGLFDVQRLPASLELIAVALVAQILPHVFERHVHRARQQRVGQLRPPIGEPVTLPLRGVEEHLIARHFDLAERGCRPYQCRQQSCANGFFQLQFPPASSFFIRSNSVSPPIADRRA